MGQEIAYDELGKASSWIRRFGDEGAFLRLWARQGAIDDPDVVRHLAERVLR